MRCLDSKSHRQNHSFLHHRQIVIIRNRCSYLVQLTLTLLTLCFIANAFGAASEACEFYETVNISSGIRQVDNTYLHKNISYPPYLYATYNYILDENGTRIEVNPHIRGCVCLLRYCLRSCCSPGQYINWEGGDGDGACRDGDGYTSVPWKVGDNSVETVDLLKEFHWVRHRPSCRLHFLDPQNVPSDSWNLLRVSTAFTMLICASDCFI